MLTALTVSGDIVTAQLCSAVDPHYCPECHESLVLKRGAIVIEHFAHHAYSDCALSEGESLRHLTMKAQVASLFPKAKYEVRVLPYRRADVIVGPTVIECQASAIGIHEFRSRIWDYNMAGFNVMWVWDLKRLAGIESFAENALLKDEIRIPAEIRECHKLSFGRVYVLDNDGILQACHFEQASPRYSDWDGGSSRTPRTLKYLDFHPTPRKLTAFIASDRKLRMASPGEHPWWTRKQR